ncbi:MAG TPA: hypothetical protein VNC59_02815 [Thermoanaerobaculia bacterium]|nr:hypothetical protein [Thermoanaerobaculia bacterium]
MAEPASPLACRRDAFGESDRAEHRRFAGELLAAVTDIEELGDGYALRFPGKPFLFLRIARWIELERACCSFLTIRLEFERPEPAYRVRLTGPDGAKDVIRTELLGLAPATVK